MSFRSLLPSRFRSKGGQVGAKDGDKTKDHHVPSSSNSQPTTSPPPAVVEAGQNPTTALPQAHPISLDEARDELTKSLRSKYPYIGLAQGTTKGPESDFLQGAQRTLEESFKNLHAIWKESAEYYEGASVGDDAVKQAVAVARNDPLTSADAYSKVIAKALLKDDAQQDTISDKTRVCMSKVFPVLSVVLGVVSSSADAAGFLPLKITANCLSQVITLASDEQSSSVAVVEGLEELSDHQQFLNSVSSLNFELDNGTDSILVKAINLLVAITDFLRISIQFLQKHFARRVWDKITTDHVNTAMKSLQDARQNFDRVVHGAASAIILRGENEKVTRKALDDMSPLTFKKTHDDVVRNRLDNSGQWLLEHPNFGKWLRGDILSLWCPGEAGAGKTVLTSVVVDHVDSYLRNQRDTKPDKRVGLVYLYCRFQNEAEQTVLQFIPAIIRQLAAQDSSTVSRVKKFNEGHSVKRATLAEYTDLFSELLDLFSAVYLMVDALDEFSKSEHERKLFVKELLSLSRKRTTLRIFITSRPDHDIAHYIDKELRSEKMDIEASDVDIRGYIERAIETNSALKSWVGKRPELRTKMLATIPNKARKIFQLAKMQIDHLETEQTVEDVIDALDSLSDNVNDYYQKSIERIESMSEARDKDIINTILKWVYFAKRPLQVVKICHILAVKHKNTSAMRLKRNVESIMESGLQTFIDRSAGLLTIREESQIVSVAHPTVQEYLKTLEATLFSAAQEEISKTCLTYLCLDKFTDGSFTLVDSLKYRVSEFPFVEYASTFWGDHLRGKPEENTALQNLALDFLRNKQVLTSSLRLAWVSLGDFKRSSFFTEHPDIVVAARFGLVSLVDGLLESGAGIEEEGEDGMTALCQASIMGHGPFVKLLLDKGANVNAQGGPYNNPLQAASFGGHLDIVKLLIDKGANVNAKRSHDGDSDYLSALHAASVAGHVQVVTMLLNEGAEVNDDEIDYGGPLGAATYGGHTAVVKVLLERGANINAQGWYGNPLCAASAGGHIGLVELLLQNRATKVKVNVEGGYKYDALFAVSSIYGGAPPNGPEAIARLLIKNGADVNANHALQGWAVQHALQAAASGGREAIVVLLLENGANVHAESIDDYDIGNALQAASGGGHEAVVRQLLKHGAEVNNPGNGVVRSHPYPLQIAAATGRLAVVRLLLEEGAEVDIKDHSGDNALWAAAGHGYEGVVKLLLEWGAIADWDEEHWEWLEVGDHWIDDETMRGIIKLIASYPQNKECGRRASYIGRCPSI
ncbi:hypothetical protein V502_07499 [Pseudogymnoascus sp. VKM F-4520 (FW-2644)]|nr:hypothetical protein V502_07499 [Pseudogymnoascus sp. VKM F-4520 (FW-2644)]